jgi:NADPH2:quinone reductase
MSGTMRALRIESPGPPESLRLREVPIPIPGQAEVRLRVAYVGMNPVDALVRRERLAWMPVKFPFTPGLEHTGIVDRVGPGVDASWIGSLVLSRVSFGGYADYSVAPVKTLLRLPEGISLRDGCVYRGCSYTAWHALHKVGRLAAGERVLVHSAAGAVGIMALQIAAAAGAHAVGLCGAKSKIPWAQSFHSGPVYSYLEADWPQSALAATEGRGFDVILDGNGGPDSAVNYTLIAPLGRIVYLGAMSGHFPAPIAVERLIGKSFSVAGMTLRQIEEPPGSEADRLIVSAVRAGRWRLPVSEIVPLERAADLHRRLEARQLCGRAVIEVSGEPSRV